MKKLIQWLAKVFNANITVFETVEKVVEKEVVRYLPPAGGRIEGDIQVRGNLFVTGDVQVDGIIQAEGYIAHKKAWEEPES
jgi:hypothetical protein